MTRIQEVNLAIGKVALLGFRACWYERRIMPGPNRINRVWSRPRRKGDCFGLRGSWFRGAVGPLFLGERIMLGGLNHVAMAVPDLAAAAEQYATPGAKVSAPQDLPEHGVTVIFVELPNTKIELLYPLGEASPGIHHLCFEIDETAAAVSATAARILGDGTPKIGAHGKPVLFAHPKDFQGALVEFEQL